MAAPKAHFAMKRGGQVGRYYFGAKPGTWERYAIYPICGAWAEGAWVKEHETTPPFNIQAQPHYQGEPCRRCVKKAKALGVAWPPSAKEAENGGAK